MSKIEYMKWWRKTPKAIATAKRYMLSEKYKEAKARYRNKPEVKLRYRMKAIRKWRSLSKQEKFEIGRKNYVKNKTKHPWLRVLYSCRSRCHNPKVAGYPWYGGKGIKCFLTKDQIRELWLRDNAFSMSNPSIDRIDSNGNYEFSNCRFIERSQNTARANFGRKRSEDYINPNGLSFSSLVCVLLHDKGIYKNYIEKNCDTYKKNFFLANLIQEIRTSKEIIERVKKSVISRSNWCDLCHSNKCCLWKKKLDCNIHRKLLINRHFPLRYNNISSKQISLDKDMKIGYTF